MDSKNAWEIVRTYSNRIDVLSDDDIFLYEEALDYILFKNLELCEKNDYELWRINVEAGAYNLADHYEEIGKYDLALKYYTMSEKFGCEMAKDRISEIKGNYCI